MFDTFVSLISNLNIFDLRQPVRFRFCSFQGFAFYIMSYMLVVSYDRLFRQQCITAATTGLQGIASGCGLTANAVIFPFVYMIFAFVAISLIRRADWSADAIFNNLSLLIIAEATANAGIYQLRNSTLFIQSNAIWYFPLLSLAVVVLVGTVSVLGQRHTRPPKWTLMIGFRASPGIFRLLAIYVLLSAAFYIGSYKLALS